MGNAQENTTKTLRSQIMRELGREGGKSTSDAKKKAARKNLAKYWQKVSRGEVPHPITGKYVNGKTKNHAKG